MPYRDAGSGLVSTAPAAAKPAAILVERGDVVPQVTGDSLDSARALESFPELSDLLAREYVPAVDTGRFVGWLLRPPS